MSLIGQPLPPFSLPDATGRLWTPADLEGRWTVLYAYPKDATPGCTREACAFRDAHGALQAAGAQVLGISRDGTARHQAFASAQRLPFPLLSDPEAALLRPLGAFGKKVLYGKEHEGVIRSTFLVGPDGRVRHVWPKVRVEGHAEEVLEKLEALRVSA
jgi:peroxiredoxin Q/BCP